MVKALGQEFGLPFLQEDLTDGELLATSPPACNLENCWRQHSTLTTEIQAHEEKYLRWRNTVVLRNGGQRDNLIQVRPPPTEARGPGPELPSHQLGGGADGQFPSGIVCSLAVGSWEGWARSSWARG